MVLKTILERVVVMLLCILLVTCTYVHVHMLQGEGFDGVVVEIWSQLGGHYKAYVRHLVLSLHEVLLSVSSTTFCSALAHSVCIVCTTDAHTVLSL